jgi:hypothetical protein
MARERNAFHHQARIEVAIATFEQNMPLRAVQRQQLITLLTNQTKPPRKSGQYDYYVVMYQLDRLPEGMLRGLFDVWQWKFLQQQLAQYKGLEAMLKQSGQLPDEEDVSDGIVAQPAAPKP